MQPNIFLTALRTVGAWAVTLLLFFPLGWLVLTSFKTELQAIHVPPLFVFEPTLEWLKAATKWIDLDNTGWGANYSATPVCNLLKNNPNPSEDEIRHGISGNLCRCTGYNKIVDAIQYAADKLRVEKGA